MNNKFLGEQGETEYTPEESALVMRVGVLVNMRWLAILGVIIATLLASQVFHISFSALPVYITCAFMALYNLVMLQQVRNLKTE